MTPLTNHLKKKPLVFLGRFSTWFSGIAERKVCLKLVYKCTVGVSHHKMLEVNKPALFRYPWTQHLVCIILFTFRHSFTQYVDVHILHLTGYSTQMCYSVNILFILTVVVLTERDTNHHLRGTSARHDDLIPALKAGSQHVKNKLETWLRNLCVYVVVYMSVCVCVNLCADIWMVASGLTAVYPGSRWENRS